ncbi:NYN domain-containing protein [Fictibacillus aquaticus]|uniref:RNA-binding protein n=1 Tax=Fictibacillus aquaticus TaxID=2021314 RepID=A0A235F6Z4_9BACL|nr:NYN domain-containing protein [Fictibacillus aquaticus]OYD57106.1 hypothetical protein CGZ90_14295 [Fictibacillus aquaticus]
MHILIVDGYNIIGAWPELRELKQVDFEKARHLLIEKMAEYKGVSGDRVIIVFDAHLSPGMEKKSSKHQVEVIYTRENETADERIERMIAELKAVNTVIHVATSDSTEQWAIFGKGALRKSARELKQEMEQVEKQIQQSMAERKLKKSASSIFLTEEVASIFEKWRRGEK